MIRALTFAVVVLAAGSAHAASGDRTVAASQPASALFAQIVNAATAMCQEAAQQGEVTSVRQCVDVVVARTLAETKREDLTAIAASERPAVLRLLRAE